MAKPKKPDTELEEDDGSSGAAGPPSSVPDHRRPEDVPDEGPPAAPEEPPAATPERIQVGQRVFFVGMTGQGKSEGLFNLFANYPGQRLLIDVQDHCELGPVALAEDPPPLEVDDPAEIDWRHRTIRYLVKRPGDRREMDRLHAAIYNRGNMFVACDEAEDVGPSQGSGAPFYVKKALKQGRKRRITYGAASQRPFGVDRALTMQAQHALVFPMVDHDDLRVMAGRLGMSVHELSRELEQLDEHEYLRHTVGSRQVIRMPALPPAAIQFTRGHVINPEFTPR